MEGRCNIYCYCIQPIMISFFFFFCCLGGPHMVWAPGPVSRMLIA